MKMWLYPLWVIISVLVFLASIALWIAAPEYTTLNSCLTAFSIALGTLLAFMRWNDIMLYVKSAYFKQVLYHSLNAFLVLAILGVVNYLGFKNYQEWDLTKEKRNSLTDQTLKVMEMIKSPLTLTVYAKREEWHPMLNLLQLYEAKNKNIKVKAVDTDVRPDLVKEKGITQNGTVILEHNGKEVSFLLEDELSVTNGLLKSLRVENIVIYNIVGHQELQCENETQEGVSELCKRLASMNYELKSLDLTKVTEIPKDATAVMILGPISGFLQAETKILEAYLARGGSLFMALAPAFKSELYNNLKELTLPFGLKLGNDIVLDRLSTVQGAEATVPIINAYEANHPVTTGFNLRTVFPMSSSVSVVQGNDSATLLAMTSSFPGSWAETDLKGVTSGKALFEEKSDIKGPIAVLGAGERVGKNAPRDSRLVLSGSSSFLVNAYQGQSGNTTLFLNAISWMVSDEGIISLNRPGLEEEPVILSAQHIQMIFIISILVVPIVFFGAAIFIYRRRRLL